ncbi:transporter [Methylobacterium sp. NEAU K]|uniref:transporter n=1 Tax=Methylobacterium sp. NEAU K TaxID=3064946 RepID=UPI0027370DF4|nr:transporter [Methylobacterium sp. NEAU K]MDP4003829.1 transporter [Methylobacterium sp. NEAU K]
MLRQIATAALATVTLFLAVTGQADAAAVTQPGEQVGLAPGLPLPEGFYAFDTFSWGRADRRDAAAIGVNIPFVIYASPLKIFGARIEPVVAFPSVFINTRFPAPIPNRDVSVFYTPFLGNIFAWNLGGGLGVSYIAGAYLPVGDRGSVGLGLRGTPLIPAASSATLTQRVGATYVGDGTLNLSAILTYNRPFDEHGRFGGPIGAAIGPLPLADQLNLDLTATKKFGHFEIGAVAFGYTDLPVNRRDRLFARFQREGNVAAGGLVGYDFGRVILQTFVTREIAARDTLDRAGRREHNEETRGWFRVIVPFPMAAAAPPAEPLIRKN